MSDHSEEILESKNNVKRVDTVLATALKAGKSVREILNCALDVAKDLYHARDFIDKDYNLARLIRHVGGHKASWTASKAIGLPAPPLPMPNRIHLLFCRQRKVLHVLRS
jgi:hypothetical protein